ncbi:MAG TPA: iron transporter [Reyranella sp.]|nr:iron transporter [Reyranella sp.]
MTHNSALHVAAIVVRLTAAIGGGYAVTAGVAALAAVVLPMLTSMPRSEAVVLASMLAFLLYLALLIWAFAERRLLRLCLILAVAGAASWAGALALARLPPAG